VASLENILADAEKIAPGLIPPAAEIANAVGVLIAHVEKIAGAELPRLADEALGVTPPPAEATGAPAYAEPAGANTERESQLEQRVAELEAEQKAAKPGGGPA